MKPYGLKSPQWWPRRCQEYDCMDNNCKTHNGGDKKNRKAKARQSAKREIKKEGS